MATRKLWITAEPWPATEAVQTQAANAGATEILHGIPATLAEVIAPATTGYVEVVVATAEVDDDGPPDADMLATAEAARRAAYDAVMASGTLSMARLREADRAGSEAFVAALGGSGD